MRAVLAGSRDCDGMAAAISCGMQPISLQQLEDVTGGARKLTKFKVGKGISLFGPKPGKKFNWADEPMFGQ